MLFLTNETSIMKLTYTIVKFIHIVYCIFSLHIIIKIKNILYPAFIYNKYILSPNMLLKYISIHCLLNQKKHLSNVYR